VLETATGSLTSSLMHSIGYATPSGFAYKYAGDFTIGDRLLPPASPSEKIVEVRTEIKNGIYAPYTASGNFFVGDGERFYLAHAFANLDNPDTWVTPFNTVLGLATYFNKDVSVIPKSSSMYIHPIAYYLKSIFGGVVMDQVPESMKAEFMKSHADAHKNPVRRGISSSNNR